MFRLAKVGTRFTQQFESERHFYQDDCQRQRKHARVFRTQKFSTIYESRDGRLSSGEV